jgi:hypothetical protein
MTAMTGNEIDALKRRLAAIANTQTRQEADMGSIARALRGSEEEGNKGILERIAAIERKVALLTLAMIPAVTLGTMGGKLLSDWLGL